MKPAAPVVLVCLSAVALFLTSCNYAKPIMYIDIANHSGHPMMNLEVKHPTGIFGLPELRNEQTHRHMAAQGAPCKFSITFEDQTGRKYSDNYDLGAKCPTEVAFDVGIGMSLSERQVRP
ncbi:MAG TPA: hypothetical protein VM578_13535 [Candidatus Saccharimonadales bacterium]|nr:hypothetical protein [Candidatus Saccharimonadales bacterium]